jgi:hypothetical protein
MALGRKPDKVKTPVISAPPQITGAEFMSPTGDQYNVQRQDNTQLFNTTLSPLTSQTIQRGQETLLNLADELNTPDAQRVENIANKALDYYTLQAKGINTQADDILSQAQSDLSKRFGGTYNSTFGADYLARLEENRLSRLSDAAKEATLYGEDLYDQDEQSRLRRFTLVSDFLTNEFDKANTVWSTASDLLQEEAGRAQNLSVARANLAQNVMQAEQEALARSRQYRLSLINTMTNVASRAFAVARGAV